MKYLERIKMKRKEINELKEKQEALKRDRDMQMEKRFRAWWELQHEINKLEELK